MQSGPKKNATPTIYPVKSSSELLYFQYSDNNDLTISNFLNIRPAFVRFDSTWTRRFPYKKKIRKKRCLAKGGSELSLARSAWFIRKQLLKICNDGSCCGFYSWLSLCTKTFSLSLTFRNTKSFSNSWRSSFWISDKIILVLPVRSKTFPSFSNELEFNNQSGKNSFFDAISKSNVIERKVIEIVLVKERSPKTIISWMLVKLTKMCL